MGMRLKRLHIVGSGALSAAVLLASAWLIAPGDDEQRSAAPQAATLGAKAARGDHAAAAMPAIDRDIAESMLRAYGH